MRKRNRTKQPLMRDSHLPLIVLGAVMTLYGVLNALVGTWLSNQAMRGLLSTGKYRSQLMGFESTSGLIAGLLFLILFILCTIHASSGVRVAFAIGALASFAPMLVGSIENLLFNVIEIPTMGAGSVLAGAVMTVVFTLPLTILLTLMACGRRVPRGCRWLAFISILFVLATAFIPIYVTVLAFLLKPGDPAVGKMMAVSTQIIKLRFILPGMSFIGLALISTRFARKHAENEIVDGPIEKGDL